jgi:lysozyme family protein
MANFKTSFEKTSKVEGGYANHPDDKGGETYRGIARKFFPNWGGWPIVDKAKTEAGFPKNIPDAELDTYVESFYKAQFWDTLKLDELNNQDIAEELYDTGVNMGTSRAAKIVQEACNLLNNRGKLYADIEVDGIVGKGTIGCINNHPYPDLLFNLLNMLQAERYIEICRKDPSQEVFMRGWLSQRVITKK